MIERRINVVTVGALSINLTEELFKLCQNRADVRIVCVLDLEANFEVISARLFENDVSFNWIFCNASDVRAGEFICNLDRLHITAPIVLECFVSSQEGNPTEHSTRLIELLNDGNRKMFLSCHEAGDTRSLTSFRSVLSAGYAISPYSSGQLGV